MQRDHDITLDDDGSAPEGAAWRCADEYAGPIRPCDVRGLLHCHTAYCDGAHSLRDMVETARDLGLEYLGFSDKARTTGHAEGLCAVSFVRQREEIEALREEFADIHLLHGIEVEADADGGLPMSDDDLARFDYVVATLTNSGELGPSARMRRALNVIANPYVSILGHPVGELMTSGGDLPLDMVALLHAAAEAGVALEVDANPAHPNLCWDYCFLAQELGVPMVISSDAHRAARLVDYRHGAELIRSAGIGCRQVLNTLDVPALGAFLGRRR